MWESIAILTAIVHLSAGKLTGDHICQEEVRYTKNVTEYFMRNSTTRVYKWCLNVPPRCSFYATKQVNDSRIIQKEFTDTIENCCPGYQPQEKTNQCIPICPVCQNGICLNGKCTCFPGFTGDNCDSACEPTKWGSNCESECTCERGTCHSTNGNCICPPGWIGSRCQQICPSGFHGPNCQAKCPCAINQECHHVTGECLSLTTASHSTNKNLVQTTPAIYTKELTSTASPIITEPPSYAKSTETHKLLTDRVKNSKGHVIVLENNGKFKSKVSTTSSDFDENLGQLKIAQIPLEQSTPRNENGQYGGTVAEDFDSSSSNYPEVETNKSSTFATTYSQHVPKVPTVSTTSTDFRETNDVEDQTNFHQKVEDIIGRSTPTKDIQDTSIESTVSIASTSSREIVNVEVQTQFHPKVETTSSRSVSVKDVEHVSKESIASIASTTFQQANSLEKIETTSFKDIENIVNKSTALPAPTSFQEISHLEDQTNFLAKNSSSNTITYSYGTKNDPMNKAGVAMALAVAVVILVLAIVGVYHFRRDKKNPKKMLSQQPIYYSGPKFPEYRQSIICTPLPDIPSSENPVFKSPLFDGSPISDEEKQFQSKAVCDIIPINAFPDPKLYLYDHPPPPTRNFRSCIPDPDNDVGNTSFINAPPSQPEDPVYDEIPSATETVPGAVPEDISSSPLYINTCARTRL